eukprot:3375922-Pyramimonas_sp.AAC.1
MPSSSSTDTTSSSTCVTSVLTSNRKANMLTHCGRLQKAAMKSANEESAQSYNVSATKCTKKLHCEPPSVMRVSGEYQRHLQ